MEIKHILKRWGQRLPDVVRPPPLPVRCGAELGERVRVVTAPPAFPPVGCQR